MTEAEWLKSSMPVSSFEHDHGWPSPRKQRLFAVACCQRIRHLLPEIRWADWSDVAERYADRRAKRDDLAAARRDVLTGADGRATYAQMLTQFGERAAYWACETKLRKYASQVATAAACAAAYSILPLEEAFVPPGHSGYKEQFWVAQNAELAAQIALVYEICGNPFRPGVAFSPSWRTDTAMSLARGMYESRDFGAMPILADALQDAGCDNDDVLNHCRGEWPHVRGCWVVDLVLGKE